MQVPGLLESVHRAIPAASSSGSFAVWTEGMRAEARRLGVPAFVNVLGNDDTPRNRQIAGDMKFDFIQTDNQADRR